MRPTARSLVLDLLSTLGRGTMPVSALVEAARLFGIEENNLRVSLARLYASRAVERDERGCYRLGDATEAMRQEVHGWRDPGSRLRAWEGGWIGVHTAGLARGRSRQRRRREQALRLLGFEELSAGLCVRPDNLAGGVPEARGRLVALGLETGTPVFGLHQLDPLTDLKARSLWDGAGLDRQYEESCAALRESEARIARLSPAEAMVESFLVGGRAIRQLVLDPLLPEPLVSADAREALVRALRRYDRIGRDCWAAFMASHGVVGVHTPADLQLAGAAQRVPAPEPTAAPRRPSGGS